MAIFKKNPNESAYPGGKKNFTNVIKNSGAGNLLIWRQPEEDFNTKSTLIVMPGEKAMFIKGGEIVQVFEHGNYTLSTENYPFISRLRNQLSGGISAFNCVVYFVRDADSHEIKWGTDAPLQVLDKAYNLNVKVGVRAIYKVRIENPALFLSKLVGNNIRFQRQEDLDQYFRNEFQEEINTAVSEFLNGWNQTLRGLEAHLKDLSAAITPHIDEMLENYGLKCAKFSVVAVKVDEAIYEKLNESQFDLIAKQRAFAGDRAGLDILGADWGKVQSAEIMKTLASNPSGGLASMGAGLGMGIGAAGAMGSMTQQVFASVDGAQNQPAQPTAEDPMETLGKLKKMLDAGLIEQSEYDSKKTEILSKM
ncbi:MAG: SPFH domain-containing protein [Clostridiales bacterium]|nr:SPFH domain-containing protein [Clostridiales bacterium]MCD7827467.1 SPFH domain-containing protein [Clostridiales bacterium]